MNTKIIDKLLTMYQLQINLLKNYGEGEITKR